MPVVAVLNRKGGSGKSTLAAHIASAWARAGRQVMLGDVDRQQSIRSWLSRRSPRANRITTWTVDQGKVFRAPVGTTHVVLDTPGALYGHDLARVVMWLDAIVVPVGPSVFDRDASLTFLEELRRLPKVASGRCQLQVVGMRWPSDKIAQWKKRGTWDVPLLTVIPENPVYRQSLDEGVTVFDRPASAVLPDAIAWGPLMTWLDGLMAASVAAGPEVGTTHGASSVVGTPAARDAHAVPGGRGLETTGAGRPGLGSAPARPAAAPGAAPVRPTEVPAFLTRPSSAPPSGSNVSPASAPALRPASSTGTTRPATTVAPAVPLPRAPTPSAPPSSTPAIGTPPASPPRPSSPLPVAPTPAPDPVAGTAAPPARPWFMRWLRGDSPDA